jgi:hypothetical protein
MGAGRVGGRRHKGLQLTHSQNVSRAT